MTIHQSTFHQRKYLLINSSIAFQLLSFVFLNYYFNLVLFSFSFLCDTSYSHIHLTELHISHVRRLIDKHFFKTGNFSFFNSSVQLIQKGNLTQRVNYAVARLNGKWRTLLYTCRKITNFPQNEAVLQTTLLLYMHSKLNLDQTAKFAYIWVQNVVYYTKAYSIVLHIND